VPPIADWHAEHLGEDDPLDVRGMILTRLRGLVPAFSLWTSHLASYIWAFRALKAQSLISPKAILQTGHQTSTDTGLDSPRQP
jgi:hypothetical protein